MYKNRCSLFSCCKRRNKSDDPSAEDPLIQADAEISDSAILLNLLQEYNTKSAHLLLLTTKSLKWQLLTMLPGAAANATIYALITTFAPQFAFAGLIAGNVGALTHALTHQLTGVDGTKGIGASIGSGVELVFNTGPVSEGVRGLGMLIKSEPASMIVATVLPAIAQAILANLLSRNRDIVQQQKQLHKLAGEIDTLKNKVGNESFDAIIFDNFGNDNPAYSIYDAMKKVQ